MLRSEDVQLLQQMQERALHNHAEQIIAKFDVRLECSKEGLSWFESGIEECSPSDETNPLKMIEFKKVSNNKYNDLCYLAWNNVEWEDSLDPNGRGWSEFKRVFQKGLDNMTYGGYSYQLGTVNNKTTCFETKYVENDEDMDYIPIIADWGVFCDKYIIKKINELNGVVHDIDNNDMEKE